MHHRASVYPGATLAEQGGNAFAERGLVRGGQHQGAARSERVEFGGDLLATATAEDHSRGRLIVEEGLGHHVGVS